MLGIRPVFVHCQKGPRWPDVASSHMWTTLHRQLWHVDMTRYARLLPARRTSHSASAYHSFQIHSLLISFFLYVWFTCVSLGEVCVSRNIQLIGEEGAISILTLPCREIHPLQLAIDVHIWVKGYCKTSLSIFKMCFKKGPFYPHAAPACGA